MAINQHLGKKGGQYADSGYGVVHRAFTVPQTKDDAAGVGTLAEAYITLPEKAHIVKFGVMSAASDVVCSTSTTFELRTSGGTKLATFVPGSAVIGTGDASGVAPETATTIAQNTAMMCCVGTNPGVSGSVYYFVDWVQQFEA
jgi:hypothetical protein